MFKKIIFCLIIVSLVVMAGCGSKAASVKPTNPLVVSGSDLPPQKLLKSDVPLKIISMTNPVWPGDQIKIIVSTKPNYYCQSRIEWINTGNPNNLIMDWHSEQARCNDSGNGNIILTAPDVPGYCRIDIKVGKTIPNIESEIITSILVN